MSEGRKIEVVISPLGRVTVEAIGFNGQGCVDATKPLEQALAGGAGVERVYKPEWALQDEDRELETHVQL